MTLKPILVTAAIAASLCSPLTVQADADAEREQLAKIANEIDRVNALVAEASRNQATTARVKFRYDWLQKDLSLMKAGIEDHLDAPRQPRPVPPLRGDYRR